jgi:hypothetical protein
MLGADATKDDIRHTMRIQVFALGILIKMEGHALLAKP